MLHLHGSIGVDVSSPSSREANHCKRHKCDQKGRHGGVQQVLDVGEKRHVRNARSQVGRFAQRRHLVAEIGTRNDGTRHPSVLQSKGSSDAHQSHADGGDGGPAAANAKAHQGAKHARSEQQPTRRNHFQAVVDHRRDDARMHPRAAQATHHQQDEVGRHRAADAHHHRILK